MTTPTYDCGQPNCWACHHRFRTREGLISIVLEEARAVVEAEKDLNDIEGRAPVLDTGTEEGDDALAEAHEQNVSDREMDMIAMIVRLSNAFHQLDAFTAANTKTA